MDAQEPPKTPLRAFTLAGRLLLIATAVVSGGIFYWYIMFVNDNLPAGRYPLPFLLIPVVIGAAIFFGVVSLILRVFGVRVWRQPDDDHSA
jgi:hypothetical protein